MKVEFEVVKFDRKELWDKELKQEKFGIDEEDFFNQHDYVGKLVIEMDEVVGWNESKVWMNDRKYNGIALELHDGFQTPVLLIDYESFKVLWEKVRSEDKIKNYKEFLNENNTKNINPNEG